MVLYMRVQDIQVMYAKTDRAQLDTVRLHADHAYMPWSSHSQHVECSVHIYICRIDQFILH